MKNRIVDISGHQLAAGRSKTMLRRAFDILSAQNPDIDWNCHNLVLAIVPKDQRALDILNIWKIGNSEKPATQEEIDKLIASIESDSE